MLALRDLILIALDENAAQDKLIAEPFTRKCSDALASVKRKTLIEVRKELLFMPPLTFRPQRSVCPGYASSLARLFLHFSHMC
jgi:hypothetical protein